MIRPICATIKLLLVFSVALSLASLPGPLASHFALPAVPSARAANAAPQTWLPSGPAMDTQVINIFQDATSEFNSFTSPTPAVDLTDFRLTGPQIFALIDNSNFQVTSPVTEQGYDEIDFHQANNFWGINFNFGNDPNGVQIRQGIAHLIDKALFAQTESDIAGSVAIDSPVPATSSYGTSTFQSPNPCNWDTLYAETGANCAVGAPGGTAYNCAFSTACPSGTLGPAAPNMWQAQIGSANFCAAATHIQNALNNGVFIFSHGVHQNANCVLLAPGQSTPSVGWPSNVTSNAPNFFVRLDDAPRLTLGDNYSQEICALFTGAYSTGCNGFLSVTHGTSLSCFIVTSTVGISLCWWMITAAFSTFPLDASIYFGYNSKFVSGGSWDHPPCASDTPSPSASNYEYICNAAYDAASSNVEFARADATHTAVQNAFSNATAAMDILGRNVLTLPSFTQEDRSAYLPGWTGVQNNIATGSQAIARSTWLNAYSATPATGSSGCPNAAPLSDGLCFRQGFKQPTRSLSPYIASTTWDEYVLGDIYDTLGAQNPQNLGQIIDWMTIRNQELGCTGVNCIGSLGYNAPAGTTDNFEFFLRPPQEMFWQDGHRVTAWDVAFSLSSLEANGAFLGTGASSDTCNTVNCADSVDVIQPGEFDVHVSNHGPFTSLGIMTTPILPGHYWSTCAANWESLVAAASASPSPRTAFPASCMMADPNKLGFTFDPISNGIFIGSGPWECLGVGTGGTPAGGLGEGCSSTDLANPPPGGSYSLTRFGFGFPPGSNPSAEYFRSNANLALYLWAGYTGDFAKDPLTFSTFATCVGQAAPAPAPCLHWQEGFGARGGPAVINGIQIGLMKRFQFINPIGPFDVNTNPPMGLAKFNPVMHQGSITLSPASLVGCPAGYDC